MHMTVMIFGLGWLNFMLTLLFIHLLWYFKTLWLLVMEIRATHYIKAYCVNIVAIYFNKPYLFQNKINYLDKIYFCFEKIKLFKHNFKKETLVQVFSCDFCEISKSLTFYIRPLGDCFWTSNIVQLRCLLTAKLLISSCGRTGEIIL